MKDEEARVVIIELKRRIDELERQLEKTTKMNGLKQPLPSTIGVRFDTGPPKFWKQVFGCHY